jgi:hypothetical protein
MSWKIGIETQIAAFTYHHAVILRLALHRPLQLRGRGLWKMNYSLLQDKHFADVLKTKWNVWKTHMKYYPSVVVWWSRYVKKCLQMTFKIEGAERRRARQRLENFYYEVMNDITRSDRIDPTQTTKLK